MSLLRTRCHPTAFNPTRLLHTCALVQPNPAVRHLAQPLAFLDVKGWDTKGLDGWKQWTKLFSEAGYSFLLVQLDPHDTKGPTDTSQALLSSLEADLHSILTSPEHGSPFPPILFSSSLSTLISQSYVSSHPLSALFLHRPTPPPSAHARQPTWFPTELQDFTYEPHFPVGVMDGLREFESSRLSREFGDEGEDGWLSRVEGSRDGQGWHKAVEWMEENAL